MDARPSMNATVFAVRMPRLHSCNALGRNRGLNVGHVFVQGPGDIDDASSKRVGTFSHFVLVGGVPQLEYQPNGV